MAYPNLHLAIMLNLLFRLTNVSIGLILMLALVLLTTFHDTIGHDPYHYFFSLFWLFISLICVTGLIFYSSKNDSFPLSHCLLFSVTLTLSVHSHHHWLWLTLLMSLAFALALGVVAIDYWRSYRQNPIEISLLQMHCIRLSMGLDLIPHFTEKLFTGSQPFFADVATFSSLNLPEAFMFVILAGLVEFSASIALCLGFMNRLTCLFTCLYFLVAGTLGKHFSHGFIWASLGGGWEFVVLWSFIILVCSFNRSFGLSVDYWLQSRFKVPGWLSMFMARKIRPSA